jgi:hypothetical protein
VESNHRAQIRSLPLYPLSYGAGALTVPQPAGGQAVVAHPDPGTGVIRAPGILRLSRWR